MHHHLQKCSFVPHCSVQYNRNRLRKELAWTPSQPLSTSHSAIWDVPSLRIPGHHLPLSCQYCMGYNSPSLQTWCFGWLTGHPGKIPAQARPAPKHSLRHAAWPSLHASFARRENKSSSLKGLWHHQLLKEKWDFHADRTWFADKTADKTANLQVSKQGAQLCPPTWCCGWSRHSLIKHPARTAVVGAGPKPRSAGESPRSKPHSAFSGLCQMKRTCLLSQPTRKQHTSWFELWKQEENPAQRLSQNCQVMQTRFD